jgi:GNAT superfamily N-acetyltransferase
MTQPYELSTDRARLNLDMIHDFLSNHAYWSPGIARARVGRAIAESDVIAAYAPDGAQVGFARAITDHATFAYIADVFVIDSHRGHGLARAMVKALIDPLDALGLRWMALRTMDAHGVYAPLGFGPDPHPERFMRRDVPTL